MSTKQNIITSTKSNTTKVLTLAAIIGSLLTAQPAMAEPNHHVELSGSACVRDGKTYVDYTARSWTMTGDGGLNDSVKLEEQHVVGGQVSGYNYVTTGSFTDSTNPKRQFANEPDKPYVINGAATKITLVSTVLDAWKNRTNGGQVNTYDIFPTSCPVATATATSTSTSTSTPTPRNTATATVTPTLTATPTPTDKQGVDEPATATSQPTVEITIVPATATTAAATATRKPNTPTMTATPSKTPEPAITETYPTPTEIATVEATPCCPTGDDAVVEPEDITVTRTDTIFSNGLVWGVYYVECVDVADTAVIELLATKRDGVTVTLTGAYCQTYVRIEGDIVSVIVVGAVAESKPNPHITSVYLPIVVR